MSIIPRSRIGRRLTALAVAAGIVAGGFQSAGAAPRRIRVPNLCCVQLYVAPSIVGNPAAVYPVWGEIRGFRGLDIGVTEADLAQAFRWFSGSAVIACHVGLNSAPHFPSRLAVVEQILPHVTPESSVLINASTYFANLPAVTPDEWDAESAQIVARVRAHSRQ